MIDSLATDVRSLVRQVMGMAPNSVRPADQDMPAGGQIDQFATVKLSDCDDIGIATLYEDDGHGGTLEATYVAKQFTASINFYRGTLADSEGVAKFSQSAMDMASRFIQLLQFSVNIDLLVTLGLGYIANGRARDLSALVDATWESRAQIDVTFMATNRESIAMPTLLSAEVDIGVQMPDGTVQTRTVEVQP